MKKKRIKNDISVKWSLFNKESGEPFILSGKDVSLYLKNMYGRKAVDDYSVQDNQILWTFFGKDQKHTGKYSLELVVNEDEEGMITTDACDFVELVSCSCKLQGGEDAPNVETESIELTSTLEYVAGGGSGDSIIVEGDVPSSALIKGTYAEASNEAATAFGGVESFLYHEGEKDERTIEVPNPTTASGLSAHAEGIGAISSGVGAHAEGNVAITNDYLNEDTGEYEQTIIVTEASGRGAHAEGLGTKSTKSGSHSEGIGTEVNANSGHGEGYYTKAHSGEGTHTEGMHTDGIGNGAHAEGYNTFAKGTAAHAEGRGGIATDYGAHVEGGYLKEGDVKLTIERLDDPDFFRYKITSPSSPNIIAGLGCNLRDGSHVIIERYEGVNELYLSKDVEDGTYIFSNVASGTSSHSEGALNVASGKAAHAEGLKNVASGPSSHVEGESNVSGGDCSHVEGYLNETDKTGVHLEGKNNSSDANYSHVEGINNTTSGDYSHVEGVGLSAIVTLKSAATETTLYEIQEDKPEWLADNDRAWIEGFGELTIKFVYDSKWIKLSKKLGIGNKATITAVIYPAQGDRLTRANAIGSHVEGIGTETTNIGESAVGRFNASVPYSDTPEGPENYASLFSVGIGTSESDRKNGFEVKANGDIYIKGISNALQEELEKKLEAEVVNSNEPTEEVPIGSDAELKEAVALGQVMVEGYALPFATNNDDKRPTTHEIRLRSTIPLESCKIEFAREITYKHSIYKGYTDDDSSYRIYQKRRKYVKCPTISSEPKRVRDVNYPIATITLYLERLKAPSESSPYYEYQLASKETGILTVHNFLGELNMGFLKNYDDDEDGLWCRWSWGRRKNIKAIGNRVFRAALVLNNIFIPFKMSATVGSHKLFTYIL